MGLNWFIPAFVKRSVGSLWGTTEDEGTAYGVHISKTPPIAQNLALNWPILSESLLVPIEARVRLAELLWETTPLRTNCMSLLLEELQESLSDHRGRPFILRIRHPTNSAAREWA